MKKDLEFYHKGLLFLIYKNIIKNIGKRPRKDLIEKWQRTQRVSSEKKQCSLSIRELHDKKRLSTEEVMPLNWGAREDSWESLGQQGDPTSQSKRKSTLNIHWKGWCWSWTSNTLATWCKEQTHWKILWCWERLQAGGEGDGRGWDGWMAPLTRWTWVIANSGKW